MGFISKEINDFSDYLSLRRAGIDSSWQQMDGGQSGVMTTEEKNELWTYLRQSLPFFVALDGGAGSGPGPNIPVFSRSNTSAEITPLLAELHSFSLLLLPEIQGYRPLHPSDSFLTQVSQAVLTAVHKVIETNVKVWEERPRALLAEQQAELNRTNLHLQGFIHDRASLIRRLIHDARGSLGLVSGAAALLSTEQSSAEHRSKFRDVLERNLTSVEEKLTEILQNFRINPSETTPDHP